MGTDDVYYKQEGYEELSKEIVSVLRELLKTN